MPLINGFPSLNNVTNNILDIGFHRFRFIDILINIVICDFDLSVTICASYARVT